MGALTPTAQVWYPGSTDSANLITLFSTLASSIENGLGARVTKLEDFVGCNLSGTNGWTQPTLGTLAVAPFSVAGGGNFNDGMTVGTNNVTVITAGMYQINLNANFLPVAAANSRINMYLYKNGASLGFSSTFGENNTARYSNCNLVGVWKLNAGDVIDVRVNVFDSGSSMNGALLSMALVTRS